jgi:hypothetical protein
MGYRAPVFHNPPPESNACHHPSSWDGSPAANFWQAKIAYQHLGGLSIFQDKTVMEPDINRGIIFPIRRHTGNSCPKIQLNRGKFFSVACNLLIAIRCSPISAVTVLNQMEITRLNRRAP